jgi:hypothetical protein
MVTIIDTHPHVVSPDTTRYPIEPRESLKPILLIEF